MISNNSKPDLRKSSVKYISCVFAIYTILSLPGSFALNCDSVVRVEYREILSYLGNVTFRAPTTVQGGKWTLNMKTTYPFSFLGVPTIQLYLMHFTNTLILQWMFDIFTTLFFRAGMSKSQVTQLKVLRLFTERKMRQFTKVPNSSYQLWYLIVYISCIKV